MQFYSVDKEESPSALGHYLQGIQHFGITTPDLKKSLTFYIDILGGRLAVGGDGFYGVELHNLLFQQDELKAKQNDITAEDGGIPDLRDGSKDALDVRFIQFGNTTLELLHFRQAQQDQWAPNVYKAISTSVGFANVSHLSFFLRSDVDVNEFALKLEEESHKRGLTEVKVHRKQQDASGESGSEDFAIDKFPDSFDGWCLIYVKGPNGEQLEFNQVRSICKDNFKEAQQQYNRLNGTDYSWPQG